MTLNGLNDHFTLYVHYYELPLTHHLLLIYCRLFIRPPGTFRKALCFTRDVFYPFLFLSPGYLRAHSADRRETSPRDRKLGALYNESPKIRPPPKEIGGPKHAKFGAISDNFRLRSRISPERVKIRYPKSENVLYRQRFLPRSTKKVR